MYGSVLWLLLLRWTSAAEDSCGIEQCPSPASDPNGSMLRPSFVLFGDSITQKSFAEGGWGAHLADEYQRKVKQQNTILHLALHTTGQRRMQAVRVSGGAPFHFARGLPHTYRMHLRPQVDVLNRGYSGYNTRWAQHLLPRVFPKAQQPPKLVTIFFGANDAALPDRSRCVPGQGPDMRPTRS